MFRIDTCAHNGNDLEGRPETGALSNDPLVVCCDFHNLIEDSPHFRRFEAYLTGLMIGSITSEEMLIVELKSSTVYKCRCQTLIKVSK